MNDQTAYWLWIQQVIGYGSVKIDSILPNYTFAEDFYTASIDDKIRLGCFRKSDIPKLKNTSLDDAKNLIKKCKNLGIDIVSYGDEIYPDMLRHISAPPAVLFVKGDLGVISEYLSIAVIGTRSATVLGKKASFNIGYAFAQSNVCTVSGGAKGIDAQSHVGALHGKGKTVCVLGCGHECGYLSDFESTRKAIAQNGAVISEYPPDFKPTKYTFPMRNRIISGISSGVIVVEAGEKSGTNITVNCALEQGRDVFVYAPLAYRGTSIGTRNLIEDGAIPINNMSDIKKEYPDYFNITLEKSQLPEEPVAENSEISDDSEKNIGYSDEQMDMIINKVKMEFPIFYKVDILSQIPMEILEKVHFAMTDREKGEWLSLAKKYINIEKVVDEYLLVLKSTADMENTDIESEFQPEKSVIGGDVVENLSDDAISVIKAIKEKDFQVDCIVENTGLSTARVHSALTELEINDIIEVIDGRSYQLKVDIPEKL